MDFFYFRCIKLVSFILLTGTIIILAYSGKTPLFTAIKNLLILLFPIIYIVEYLIKPEFLSVCIHQNIFQLKHYKYSLFDSSFLPHRIIINLNENDLYFSIRELEQHFELLLIKKYKKLSIELSNKYINLEEFLVFLQSHEFKVNS